MYVAADHVIFELAKQLLKDGHNIEADIAFTLYRHIKDYEVAISPIRVRPLFPESLGVKTFGHVSIE